MENEGNLKNMTPNGVDELIACVHTMAALHTSSKI